MKKFGLAVILVAPLGAGTTLTVTAQTAPAGLSGQLGAAADSLNMLEQTQYIYGGRRYCWYFDGWRGPSWYRCGYVSEFTSSKDGLGLIKAFMQSKDAKLRRGIVHLVDQIADRHEV